MPISVIAPSQAAVFAWPSLAVIGALGWLGLWLSKRTEFPERWEARISSRGRLLGPAGLGVGAGMLFLVVEGLTHSEQTALAATGQTSINVPSPASLYFYPAGAIITEILYRLAPLPILLWLISNLGLRGRWQGQVFWVLAVLTSLIEPTSQLVVFRGHAEVMLALGTAIFAINLLEAWLFWEYGFLAPLTFRHAYYLVWHILGACSLSEMSEDVLCLAGKSRKRLGALACYSWALASR